MSNLDMDILRQKPSVTERTRTNVILNLSSNSLIDDKRQSGFDVNALLKRMEDSNVSKVFKKPNIVEAKVNIIDKSLEKPVKKTVKAITEKPKLVIEEDLGEEIEGAEKIEGAEEVEGIIPIVEPPQRKERRTKAVEKGIAVIGPETLVEVGEESIMKRIPKREAPVNIKVSSYYMNNRKHFINFINSAFSQYQDEIEENSDSISCDNIGNTKGNFSLLTHQKIVRDYMNVFTPYRGLLLFHGLGS